MCMWCEHITHTHTHTANYVWTIIHKQKPKKWSLHLAIHTCTMHAHPHVHAHYTHGAHTHSMDPQTTRVMCNSYTYTDHYSVNGHHSAMWNVFWGRQTDDSWQYMFIILSSLQLLHNTRSRYMHILAHVHTLSLSLLSHTRAHTHIQHPNTSIPNRAPKPTY